MTLPLRRGGRAGPPVIGLSGAVLDPRLNDGRIDGIGVYTRAIEREMPAVGMTTCRVGAPVFAGRSLHGPPPGTLAFKAPIAASVAASTVLGIRVLPGAARVEAAIDLYHATDYQVPPLRRTPVVATIHDTIPLSRPDWASARLRGLKNWVLRSAVPRADLIIAISEATIPAIVEHYRVPAERIRVIPGGVDVRWCEPQSPEAVAATLDRLRLRPGYFLFVGTLQPRKNLSTLLAAYDRLPAAVRAARSLVIVGRVGWGVADLERDLRRREALGCSHWLDYVDETVLKHLYAAAGAFVMPSLAEGFGLPLVEALAHGLPVVASDLPVFREVMGRHAVFVAPQDPEAMADAMQRAVDCVPEPADVALRRAHARQYSWSAIAARTAAVYAELL